MQSIHAFPSLTVISSRNSGHFCALGCSFLSRTVARLTVCRGAATASPSLAAMAAMTSPYCDLFGEGACARRGVTAYSFVASPPRTTNDDMVSLPFLLSFGMEALPSISEYHSSPAMTYCFLAKQWENVWPIIEFLIVFLLAMENNVCSDPEFLRNLVRDVYRALTFEKP